MVTELCFRRAPCQAHFDVHQHHRSPESILGVVRPDGTNRVLRGCRLPLAKTSFSPGTDNAGYERVMQLASGLAISSALYTATRLGIPDLLAQGARCISELAASTGSNQDALYRQLRALAGVGVFSETLNRRFGLTPIS